MFRLLTCNRPDNFVINLFDMLQQHGHRDAVAVVFPRDSYISHSAVHGMQWALFAGGHFKLQSKHSTHRRGRGREAHQTSPLQVLSA